MPTGSRILKKATNICIGDMGTKVKLYQRSQKAPLNTKYGLQLELICSPYAMWETTAGREIFDGVNIIGTATDVFTLYYMEKLVKKTDCGSIFIEYDNTLYKCLLIKPTDKKNKIFMQLYCVENGTTKRGVNVL